MSQVLALTKSHQVARMTSCRPVDYITCCSLSCWDQVGQTGESCSWRTMLLQLLLMVSGFVEWSQQLCYLALAYDCCCKTGIANGAPELIWAGTVYRRMCFSWYMLFV